MDTNIYLLKKYYLYTKERFPLPATFSYAAALYYMSYFFPNIIEGHTPVDLLESIMGCLVLFMVLFQIRILDEHKDYAKDASAFPDRMLSRGTITLPDLRKLLIVLVMLQCAMALYLGAWPFVIWLAIQAYVYLMFKEFFAPEYLNKRTWFYLLSHQLLVPLALLLGISQRLSLAEAVSEHPGFLFIFLSGSMMATVNFEIARKTWSPDREREHADSYTKVWGIGGAVFANQVVAALAGCAFTYFYISIFRSLIYSVIIGTVYLAFLAVEFIFTVRRDNKTSKMVETAGAIYSLALLSVSAVYFFNAG
ncbi:MAG: hypothetical protein A2176_05370 [Spirochaetes bacterium RBG_13_51_14]|nr:MAG: hypothetical protein A2176_05370 [Spirochaetes bacterium RBG_13_51_14]